MQLGQKGGQKLNSGKQTVGHSRKLRDVRRQLDIRARDSRKASRFMDREQKAAWDAMPTDQKQRLIREAAGNGYRGVYASAGKSAGQAASTRREKTSIDPGAGNTGAAALPSGRRYKIRWQYRMPVGTSGNVPTEKRKKQDPGQGGSSRPPRLAVGRIPPVQALEEKADPHAEKSGRKKAATIAARNRKGIYSKKGITGRTAGEEVSFRKNGYEKQVQPVPETVSLQQKSHKGHQPDKTWSVCFFPAFFRHNEPDKTEPGYSIRRAPPEGNPEDSKGDLLQGTGQRPFFHHAFPTTDTAKDKLTKEMQPVFHFSGIIREEDLTDYQCRVLAESVSDYLKQSCVADFRGIAGRKRRIHSLPGSIRQAWKNRGGSEEGGVEEETGKILGIAFSPVRQVARHRAMMRLGKTIRSVSGITGKALGRAGKTALAAAGWAVRLAGEILKGILLAAVPLTAVLLVLMVVLAAVFFPILSGWLSTSSGMRMYSGMSREYDSICYLVSKYESGGNPDDAGGDGGRACGELQFDCEYGLGPFVSWCYEQDPVFYAPFAPFLGMTMELLRNQEFFSAWHTVCAQDKARFEYDQFDYVISGAEDCLNHRLEVLTERYGFDFVHCSNALKGCILSITNRFGSYDLMYHYFYCTPESTEESIINQAYTLMMDRLPKIQRWNERNEWGDCLKLLHGELDIYMPDERPAGGIDWSWKMSAAYLGANAAGQAVVEYCRQHVGDEYNQDYRDSPGIYDCSSLVYRAYAYAGITYMEGMRAVDEAVFLYDHGMTFTDRNQLQPGDLIFSTSSPKYELTNDGTMLGIGHVRIYIGNGEMIHASGRKRGVVLEPAVYSDLSTGELYGRPLPLGS